MIQIHRIPRFLLLMLLCCAPLFGQQSDRMISVEPTTAELPEEIRIQSSASIGSAMIALWGANRAEGNDSAVSTLVYQMLRDLGPVGSPIQAHSDEARPSRFCSVIPFDDRFLLLWNDRRIGAPGIYSRWVDSAGSFLADEVLFSRGTIVDPNGIRTYRTTAGVMVIWSDWRDSIQELYLKRMTGDGAFAEEEKTIGAEQIDAVVRLGELKDLAGLRNDTAMRILHADGTFDTRTIPIARFAGSYYIGADSTMMILTDTILTIYANMFDVVPLRTVVVAPLRDILSYAVALTHDTSGGIAVTYSYVVDAPIGRSIAILVKQLVIGDSVGAPRLLDSVYFFNYSSSAERHTELYQATLIHGCGNGIHLYHNFRFYTLPDRNGYSFSQTYQWRYSVENSGAYRRIAPSTPVVPCYSIDGPATLLPALRLRSEETSSIRVSGPLSEIDLATPVPLHKYGCAQSVPNIFRRGEDLIVTWSQPVAAVSGVMARWNPDLDSTRVMATSALGGYHLRMGNTTAIVKEVAWVYRDRYETKYFTWVTVQIADSQWSIRDDNRYRYWDRSLYGRTTENSKLYNPNSNESTGYFLNPSFSPQSAFGLRVDSNGYVLRSMTTPDFMVAFALDSTAIAIYNRSPPGRFYHTVGTTSVASFDLVPPPFDNAIFRRLYGPRFLGLTPANSSSDLRVDIYSLMGVREVGRTLPVSRTYRNPIIVESPIDSSIHIIWTADDGIRLTRFDRYLNVAVIDSLISSGPGKLNPAAVFRHDTLFVVWQEERNGPSDIYATTWRARLLRGIPPAVHDTTTPSDTLGPPPEPPAPGSPRGAVAITAITPNPADRVATFFIDLAEPGDAVAEILDMTGQVLIRREKTFDVASGRWDIDISDLASGLYVIAVRTGNGVAMTKLVVIRE